MEKQIYNLKVDTELKDLLPPLNPDEKKKLEENLKNNGCQNPIFTWHGFIADGHNRYELCHKNQIPFAIAELGFDSKDEVIKWMIDGQLGRRNLTPIQRISVVQKYESVIREKAKERQKTSTGGAHPQLMPKSAEAEKIETRTELAKLANVGHDTYDKGSKILKSDNENIKNEVLTGKSSINEGFQKLRVNQSDNEEIKNKVNSGEMKPSEGLKIIKQAEKKKQETPKAISPVNNLPNEIDNASVTEGTDTSYIDTSTEVGKIIMDLKTPKIAADYIVVKDELLSIKNHIQDMIDVADERIFERYNLPDKMTQEDKNDAISYMNQLSGALLKLKNKIEKIKIKGEN